jgi:hypothetical protein
MQCVSVHRITRSQYSMLQVGRSRVPFPMRLLDFPTYISPAALCSCDLLSLLQKLVSEIFLGSKSAAGAQGWQPHCHLCDICLENVGASMSHNSKGLHGVISLPFTFTYFDHVCVTFSAKQCRQNWRNYPFPLSCEIYIWKENSVAWIRDWTSPTERPPLVCEVGANFCW